MTERHDGEDMTPDDLHTTEQLLRDALRVDAAAIAPTDRLDDTLERARRPRPLHVVAPERSRPVLWGLGAAAAAAAVVVAVWAGGQQPTQPPVPGGSGSPAPSGVSGTTPGPTGASTTGSASTGPTGTDTTGPTAGVAVTVALPVYRIGADVGPGWGTDGWAGGAGAPPVLVREFVPTRLADDTVSLRVRRAVEASMHGPAGAAAPVPDTEATAAAVSGSGITITLSGPGRTTAQGPARDVIMAALVYTAQAAVGQGDLPVRFEVPAGSGPLLGAYPADRSWTRSSFPEVTLADIWVNDPGPGVLLPAGKAVTLSGDAVAFEAQLSWSLTGPALPGGRSGSVMTSDGAPARGHFTVDLGVLPAGDYTVTVSAASAKDGSTHAERVVPFTVR